MNSSAAVCQAKNVPPPTAQSVQVEAQVEAMDPGEGIALEEGQEDGDQVEDVAVVVVVVMEGGNGRDGLLILHAEVEDVVVDLLAMEEEAVEAMVEEIVEVMGQAVVEVAREFLNKSVELFRNNNAKLYQDNNVEQLTSNNAEMCQDSSVEMFQNSNVEMYQDKNAQQFQGKNVLNNANPLPGAKCAAKSVTYLF